ncbi:conserved hypothetical protein [Desulfonatronospira thiodismutans ASO3-1]|uniref:PIN domain-containing protein n=1 Tax=Desulfonatronospira thiodismutans ASO3-1 TaxID=555779 RepID=D6SN10_9BACT|nr:PIN domain-containing protein [Desulfonatronospira thiodismutans]EFI36071.1 conserved hypothetical protein [Desulfonatronospira thiodismutans ASO3-1]
MITIADTGFVVGVAISTDKWHNECLNLYLKQSAVVLPQTVLAEVAYLITRAGGNLVMSKFLKNFSRTKYRLMALDSADISRSAILLEQYADTRIDFVDSTVVAMAERLNIQTILTTDHRDFRIVRPQHVNSFDIQPNL